MVRYSSQSAAEATPYVADARAGAKEALPGWSQARARVAVSGGEVEVHLRPPSPLRALADRLEVSAKAAVEAP